MDSHGAAGFPSAEAYKLGSAYPYARVQRYFVRQTIDLGGETQKVDADINQFAGSQTANRLVLTVGKFAVVDIFDTNKYANNAKSDFLNWSVVNAGSFDYAGDGWGYSYGAAAEWYQGRWTLRGGIFDLSATPAGGVSPTGADLDPTFDQFQLVGEIEERHELWGEPGKLKITGFLSRGRAGSFQPLRLRWHRPARRHQRRAHVYQPARREPQSGAASFAELGRVRPRRLGRRQRRAVGFHRHRPHRIGRRLDQRQTMGPAGRHRRPCRRRQRHFRRARRHFSTPEASASWSATDNCRIPVSSRSSRPITATLFPPRRKSPSTISSSPTRLQRRPRAGECFCRALPRRILKPRIEGERRQRGLARLGLQRGRESCNGGRLAIKLGDQDLNVMVDCRDRSSNMIQRLGNVVSSVIVSLRRNKRTNGADWPADAVFTRHRFVSASSQNFFDTPRK